MVRDRRVAVVVHRWGAMPTSDWYPWLQSQLELRGYSVVVPAMPDTNVPTITACTECLRDTLTNIDTPHLLLVGHSIGCQTIMRCLVSEDIAVEKALFVAPWVSLGNLTPEEQHVVAPWLTTQFDAKVVRSKLGKLTAFFSDDDPYVDRSNQEFFRDQLGADLVTLKAYGHFDEDTDIREFPEILNYI